MEVFCKLDLEVFKEYIEDGLLLESLRSTNTVDIVNHKFSNGYNKRTIKEEVEALLRDDFPEAKVYMVNVRQLEESEVSRIMEDEDAFVEMAKEKGKVISLDIFEAYYNTTTDNNEYCIRII